MAGGSAGEGWRASRRTGRHNHGREGRDWKRAVHKMNALLLAFALVQAAPDCGKSLAAGLQEYQRKDLNKALIAFRTAAQCDPKLVQAYLAIANIYFERGNEGEALTALLQALQIEPKNLLALRAASNLYLRNDQH